MTQMQSSKRRRGETSPKEKMLLAAASENETAEDYRKRVRTLEVKVEELERIARSLGYCVDGRYE